MAERRGSRVASASAVALRNVTFGEVWLCAGQSNAWLVTGARSCHQRDDGGHRFGWTIVDWFLNFGSARLAHTLA
mgnify:CR=1 FL=1